MYNSSGRQNSGTYVSDSLHRGTGSDTTSTQELERMWKQMQATNYATYGTLETAAERELAYPPIYNYTYGYNVPNSHHAFPTNYSFDTEHRRALSATDYGRVRLLNHPTSEKKMWPATDSREGEIQNIWEPQRGEYAPKRLEEEWISITGTRGRSQLSTQDSRSSSRSRSQSPLLKLKTWATSSFRKTPRVKKVDKKEKRTRLTCSDIIERSQSTKGDSEVGNMAISPVNAYSSSPDLLQMERQYFCRLSEPQMLQNRNKGARNTRRLIVLDLDGLLWSRKGKRILMKKGVEEFLNHCFSMGDVGFWTSSTSKNVWPALEGLLTQEQRQNMAFFWDRSMCLRSPSIHLPHGTRKPIRKIRKLLPKYMDAKIVFIDDTESKMSDNAPENVIIQDPSMQFDETLRLITKRFIKQSLQDWRLWFN